MPEALIHGEISADERQIVLIGTGPDFAVAQAAKRLQSLTPKISKSSPPGALVLPATWAAVVQLAFEFGAQWRPGPKLAAWISRRLVERQASGTPSHCRAADEVPDGLSPYPWQIAGALMIGGLGRVLITDEPGTGKTVTALLGLVERGFADPALLAGKGRGPVVVVCPASVVDSWVEAWNRWAPRFRTIPWRGTPAKRRELIGKADVYVTSYDLARADAGTTSGHRALLDLAPAGIVIDECHMIKNHQAGRSQAVRRIAERCRAIVALSGTPITHHPGDLWPTLFAMEPGAWPSRKRWVARYCDTVSGDYSEDVVGLNRLRETEFRTTLLGQHRRVAKADVLDQLPPKVYSVRTVDLPGPYRTAYDDMELRMLAELPDGGEISVMSVLAKLTRLAQLSSAAADVELISDGQPHDAIDDESTKDMYRVTLRLPSWKVDALLEVLEERPGQPVVAFAPSAQLIRLAGEAASKAGWSVGYIIGGQSPAERTQNVEAFQAGKLDLICVTTGAGGVGLTLTAARTAVFLQRPWSLVEALQAEDRIHRIGSERHDSVEIIDIVARDTIDDRVRSVLKDKAGQLADLVQDPRIVAELLGGSSVRSLRKAV